MADREHGILAEDQQGTVIDWSLASIQIEVSPTFINVQEAPYHSTPTLHCSFKMLSKYFFLLSVVFGTLAASDSSPARIKACVIPSKYLSWNGSADDSPAVAAAFAKGLSNSVIIFSEGVDYNIFAPISTKNLSNFAIQMQGNPHLPQNATAIQNLLNACNALTYSTALYWFTFASPSIDCVGPSNVSNSWINSYGQAWWDKNPVNGTGIANRPHLMSFNTTSGSMSNFKSRKPIS